MLEFSVSNKHAAVLFVVQNVVYKLFSYSRYTDLDTLQFLKESSCLDPRFRSMPYLDETKKLDVYTALTLKAVSLNEKIGNFYKPTFTACTDSTELSYKHIK